MSAGRPFSAFIISIISLKTLIKKDIHIFNVYSENQIKKKITEYKFPFLCVNK